jgi:dipeptidyl aminopeptidase/acylaminoacyl peptidase
MPNSLDPHQTTLSDPLALTTNGTASAITPLSDGRVVFMRSSFTTPNDVFILESEHSDRSLVNSGTRERRLTDFYKVALAGKSLHAGEDIRWTGGAVADRELQGWVFLPPGFKRGEKKKWPALLMIHGTSPSKPKSADAERYVGGPHVNWQDIWFPRYNLNGAKARS